MKNTRPVAIDLFSGAGGMSLGIEASGFDVRYCVELDPIHCAVHKFNFPDCETVCSDLRLLNAGGFFDNIQCDIDLIVGGPPCQGFSHIGQRQFDDPRNSLVYEYCKVLKKIKPKYFLFENVPGISTGKHQIFLLELIEKLERMGYNVQSPRILNAADFGVPQNRKRLILLGARDGLPIPTFPKPTHAPQPSLLNNIEHYLGAKDAIGDLENIDVYLDTDLGIPVDKLDYSGPRSIYSFDPLSQYYLCHRRGFRNRIVFGHIGSKHTKVSTDRFIKTPQGATEPISRFYKLHPLHPCNTLRAGTASDRGAYTAPRPIHYSKPRCISVREAARLHSYPDWFMFHSTIWHGFREIGNSVAPLFAKNLGDVIIEALGVDVSTIGFSQLAPSDLLLLNMNMTEASNYFGVSQVIPPRRRANA